MPRPKRKRTVCSEPDYVRFRPDGIPPTEEVILSIDEFETVRLVDYEKKTHEEAAKRMNISRTTVTEIYETARYKISDSLVNGKRLAIDGGEYRLCDGHSKCCTKEKCRKNNELKADIPQKGTDIMRIAVTYENGMIFQHFGHTEMFKIYDINGSEIISSKLVPTNGNGHGALAGFLVSNSVDALICGGIGGGAQTALAEAGIKLYGGVSGDADEAVKAYLSGTLGYDPDVHCSHHEHENTAGGHSCGNHGCGSHNHDH